MNNIKVTYNFRTEGFLKLPISDRSTLWSFDNTPILSFSCAIWIFLNSSATSKHGLVLFCRPHMQVMGTFVLQSVSGHGGSWHATLQGCPHRERGTIQGCLHGIGQGPSWHIFIHLCLPHARSFPHGMPQLKFSWWHTIAARCSCLPKHHLLTNTVQGGQGPVWHVWLTSWPHSRGLEQGLLHTGGLVPQGIGGYNTLAPHSQKSSSKLVSMQGKHLPEWHVCSHLCLPHVNKRLQGRGQTWSISMQQCWLHLCFPHKRFCKKKKKHFSYFFSTPSLDCLYYYSSTNPSLHALSAFPRLINKIRNNFYSEKYSDHRFLVPFSNLLSGVFL